MKKSFTAIAIVMMALSTSPSFTVYAAEQTEKEIAVAKQVKLESDRKAAADAFIAKANFVLSENKQALLTADQEKSVLSKVQNMDSPNDFIDMFNPSSPKYDEAKGKSVLIELGLSQETLPFLISGLSGVQKSKPEQDSSLDKNKADIVSDILFSHGEKDEGMPPVLLDDEKTKVLDAIKSGQLADDSFKDENREKLEQWVIDNFRPGKGWVVTKAGNVVNDRDAEKPVFTEDELSDPYGFVLKNFDLMRERLMVKYKDDQTDLSEEDRMRFDLIKAGIDDFDKALIKTVIDEGRLTKDVIYERGADKLTAWLSETLFGPVARLYKKANKQACKVGAEPSEAELATNADYQRTQSRNPEAEAELRRRATDLNPEVQEPAILPPAIAESTERPVPVPEVNNVDAEQQAKENPGFFSGLRTRVSRFFGGDSGIPEDSK